VVNFLPARRIDPKAAPLLAKFLLPFQDKVVFAIISSTSASLTLGLLLLRIYHSSAGYCIHQPSTDTRGLKFTVSGDLRGWHDLSSIESEGGGGSEGSGEKYSENVM
jgi:hypothetical protein